MTAVHSLTQENKASLTTVLEKIVPEIRPTAVKTLGFMDSETRSSHVRSLNSTALAALVSSNNLELSSSVATLFSAPENKAVSSSIRREISHSDEVTMDFAPRGPGVWAISPRSASDVQVNPRAAYIGENEKEKPKKEPGRQCVIS